MNTLSNGSTFNTKQSGKSFPCILDEIRYTAKLFSRLTLVVYGIATFKYFQIVIRLLFTWALETLKSGLMTILKDFHAYLLLYQFLHDLTKPIGCNLISVLVLLTNALGHSLISVLGLTYQFTWPQINISHCSLKCQTILLFLRTSPFLTAPGYFCLTLAILTCAYVTMRIPDLSLP